MVGEGGGLYNCSKVVFSNFDLHDPFTSRATAKAVPARATLRLRATARASTQSQIAIE